MPKAFAAAAALLPQELRERASALPLPVRSACEELRLRIGRVPTARGGAGETAFSAAPVTARTLSDVLERATGASLHAVGDELRRGFVCAPGGVRVGVCGTAVCTRGALASLRAVSSLCLRVARAVPGAGREVLPQLSRGSVLIVSPPGGGKTTFLRELIRTQSAAGVRVAVADERGEIAGCDAAGAPGFDLGACTDVLTGAPKAEGALMLLRAMSPEAVAMDEIGDDADADAVAALLGCGVRVFATAHAEGRETLTRRAVLRRLLDAGAFDTLVRISGRGGARRYEAIAL